MSLLAPDSRWRRFNDDTRQCPCCGQSFNGIYDLGFDYPDDWPHGPRKDQDVIQVGEDALTSDMCRFDGRYFLRCVLPLPVRGADDHMSFGPWAEVSEETVQAYSATYGADPKPFSGGEGLLANALPGFEDSAQTAVTLAETSPAERPSLSAIDGDLAEAQANGISFDELLDIYAAAGNDLRPHLTQD
ncbi:DUF2199 domain-containing protein [uncultured Pelagimonas sp.]|uniref:DUF2199 domain-containing protein n=1 Tax=uncultured Pelagimonas sp. TaxID=1618102 RepID=UPI002606253B|nr:DUF2199 domain-containing protein [uncultured Pelagimonas sp.]